MERPRFLPVTPDAGYLQAEGLALRARTAHRLPAWLLASFLALLLMPGVASACTSFVPTHTWTGGGVDDNWTNAANWDSGVPLATDLVCIPASTAPSGAAPVIVNSALALASAIEVENGAGLAVSLGNVLTVGPSSGPNQSAIHGDVTINAGTLAFRSMNVAYDAGSLTLTGGGTLDLDANTTFSITNSMDITDLGGGFNQILNAGILSTTAKDPDPVADPVLIGSVVTNTGSVRNQAGTLRLLGGASGSGSWSPGSDGVLEEARLELFGPSTYTFDGPISDVDAGGVGHVLVSGTTLFMSNPASTIDVYEMTVDAAAGGLDFTGTSMSTDYFTLKAGSVDASAVQPTSFGNLTVRDGQMVGISEWSASFFHWGGGMLESGSGQSLQVGTLDMSVAAGLGDTGIRDANQRDLVVSGAGTENYPFNTGTLDLRGNTDLTIGSGVRFVLSGNVNVDRTTGTGRIVVHGMLDKSGAATTSSIAPDVDNPDGTVKVSSGTLILAVPPLQYDAGLDTLTAGTWILNGTLRFPGPMAALSTGVHFDGGHLEDSTAGNADALTTLTSNAAGNTIALGGTSQLTPPADFTNLGTVNLSGTAAITVAGGFDYISNDSAAVTNLGAANSGITTSGGGQVSVALGTISGVGTITGNVVNNGGTVAPGNSPGTMTITGDYSQSGTGVLTMEIAGPAAGQFDQLVVTGQANLGGTLIMQGVGGYIPPDGQSFDLITAASRAGTFGGIFQFPDHPYFDAYYGAGATPALRVVANSLSAGDVTVTEGDSGTVDATFTISLGAASPLAVSVDWVTQDGTATAGSDYVATRGIVNFAPGETTKTVTVTVNGDTVEEANENFAINLSNPVNSLIRDGQGVGTITSDDASGAAVPVAQTAQVPPDDIDGFATAPPPIQGKAVNVQPVSGTVRVKLPRTTRFVLLPDAEQVPVGTIVDARKGVVRLFSVGRGGRIQSALFYQGMFQVRQRRGQALTQLKLLGGNRARTCGRASRAQASARRRKRSGSKSVRRLWGNGSGQFRTVGQYASATIRGTKWLTDDRCNGTLIRVTVGAVTVRDLTRKRSVIVRRGKSYLAPAKRR